MGSLIEKTVQLLKDIKEQLSKNLQNLLKQSTAKARGDSDLKITTNRDKETEKPYRTPPESIRK